jgi:nucleotide-binding universal stress UspA family protein
MLEFKRLLVPLDGSPLAERALPVALSLAQKLDSTIILFRALEISAPSIPALYPDTALSLAREAHEHVRTEVEQYLAAKEGELKAQGYDVETELRDEPPAEGILDTASAKEIDLIVMSTHGRGGLARWTFGSVADKVARHSPCPVLLVR